VDLAERERKSENESTSTENMPHLEFILSQAPTCAHALGQNYASWLSTENASKWHAGVTVGGSMMTLLMRTQTEPEAAFKPWRQGRQTAAFRPGTV